MWSLKLLQRVALLLPVSVVFLVEGRGRRGRRGRRSGNKAKKANKRTGKDSFSWGWSKNVPKTEQAVTDCGEKAPLPPETDKSATTDAPSGETWRYLLFSAKDHLQSGNRLEQVGWTQERETFCRDLFVNGKPPVSSASGKSSLVCVLSPSQDGGRSEEALFASDYNSERGLPNYVAFVLPGRSNSTRVERPPASQEPIAAVLDLDASYAPGVPESCCWCAGNAEEGSSSPSPWECTERVGARGHLAPLSAFHADHKLAADAFLNTVPMRSPFMEDQWTRRVSDMMDNGQFMGQRGRRLHVLIGPSLQSDARLPATVAGSDERVTWETGSGSDRSVEVPSFLWATYADPVAIAASGFVCRNGGTDGTCACVDGLKSTEMEARLGFALYPGMHARPAELTNPRNPQNTSSTFIFIGGSAIAIVLLVMFCIAAFGASESEHPKNRREKVHIQDRINQRAKLESKAGEKKLRAEIESRAGGSEALRARFRNV